MSVWNSALNILARREHSQHELRVKLSSKFPDSEEEIELVLTRLIDQGLQSDQRFVELWLRSQIAKGRGPSRIVFESKQKGVQHLIEGAIADQGIDWYENALTILNRKFRSISDQKEKAKAFRYLSYRGFNSDMIQYALEQFSPADF